MRGKPVRYRAVKKDRIVGVGRPGLAAETEGERDKPFMLSSG
jgi:hypothetical protein